MYPQTPDPNQQLFAYLHAWRQFLEQLAVMAGGLAPPSAPYGWPTAPGVQFTPPTAPLIPRFMPPTPTAWAPPTASAPPAPADYTQQLFSYLQAWRQYLEQMTGAAGPTPSGDDTGSKTTPGSDATKGSNPSWPPPQSDMQPQSPGWSQSVGSDFSQATPLLNLPPTSGEYRSELKSPASDQPNPFGHGLDGTQLLNPPDYAFGYRDRPSPGTVPAGTVGYTAESYTPDAAVQLPVASPFSAAMERVEPDPAPPPAPQSLFSSPGEQAASAKG